MSINLINHLLKYLFIFTVKSSSTVSNISSEIKNAKGALTQSEKLLNKYGQRETTDKILIMFAFAFFLCVVAYIVQKRLF